MKDDKDSSCGLIIHRSLDKYCLNFSGTARRAGPDRMLIVRICICVSEIISRPLIG